MVISDQMKALLTYLAKAEGVLIHKLDGEKDITSMYGIYRFQNPQANIFKKIDSIALELGIKIPSSSWSKKELDLINDHIQNNKDLINTLFLLVVEFYEDYYSYIRLDLFHEDCVVAVASMFANSRRLSIKAIQYGINTMNQNGFIELNKNLLEDGKLGEKTLKALEVCLYACKTAVNVSLLFESYMLLGMSAEYSILIKEDSRYLHFSTGWDNRLKKLQQTR